MKMYRCTKCGYMYNPNTGDAKQNIAAGTPFDQLPDAWRCPRCRATKDKFVEVEV
ncbi:MAG: rubredoxin [Methanomicrobiales archaeon]